MPSVPVFRDLQSLLLEDGIIADVHVVEDPPRPLLGENPEQMLNGIAGLLGLTTAVERG